MKKSERGIEESSYDGLLNVCDLSDNENIATLAINGNQLDKVRAQNGTADIAISEKAVICKIGVRNIRIQVKH